MDTSFDSIVLVKQSLLKLILESFSKFYTYFTMLEKEDKITHQRIPTLSTTKNMSSRSLEDHMIALSQRMTLIQENFGSKIDRTECLLILETKVNMSNLSKISDELTSKFVNYEKVLGEKIFQAKRNRKASLSKPKSVAKQPKKGSSKNILFMKPQQLYLESNETMFSLAVEQIEELRKSIKAMEQKLEHKGKTTFNLSNEICQKIQRLQKQLRQSVKMPRQMTETESIESNTSCWSHLEETKSIKLRQSKQNLSKKSLHHKQFSSLFENSNLNIKIQQIQRQLASKISIKDIATMMKNNMDPLQQKIDALKTYTSQTIENTKKIFMNQSEINQQLCCVSKMGWWYSFEQMNGFALWNKQIANMDPNCFVSQKQSSVITLTKKGHYIVKILSLNAPSPSMIVVGDNEIEVEHESLIEVESDTNIRLPSQGNEMFLSIQKI